MNNPVGWFEIYVQDMARAKAFYEKLLGIKLTPIDDLELEAGMELWAFPMEFECFGASGALVKMDGFASGANSVLVYFSCTDCAVEAKMAKEAGGTIQQEKKSIGQYGFMALVVDTEGNMIGLHSMQ